MLAMLGEFGMMILLVSTEAPMLYRIQGFGRRGLCVQALSFYSCSGSAIGNVILAVWGAAAG